MKANIDVSLEGVRGGEIKVSNNKGSITAYIDGKDDPQPNYIHIDAFVGQGSAYQRRDKCRIKIKGKDGKMWDGTFDELINKLLQ